MGSDKRWQDQSDDPARSDTLMLIRIDPEQDATTVLSIPRDLRVAIPGHGLAKINDAYALGGAKLAVETVKALTGLEINHTVNVNFKGFRKVVNLFDCFYVDVDRDYFHSNKGVPFGQRYDAIDIDPGYQPLCGQKALDYARYRHGDSRPHEGGAPAGLPALRQGPGQHERAHRRHRASSPRRSSTRPRPTRTCARRRASCGWPSSSLGRRPTCRSARSRSPRRSSRTCRASRRSTTSRPRRCEIAKTVDLFLHGGRRSAEPRPLVKRKVKRLAADAQLVDARARGREATATIRRKAGFTVRFPAFLTRAGATERRRTRRARTACATAAAPCIAPTGSSWRTTRGDGQFYGVQGTTWRNPPLLA